MIQYFVLLLCFCVWVRLALWMLRSVSMPFQSAGSAAWLGLHYATYWYLGLLADSLIIGQPAQMRSLSFLFCWPVLLPPVGLLCLGLWYFILRNFRAPISGSPGLLTFRNSASIFLNSHLWGKTAIIKLNNT